MRLNNVQCAVIKDKSLKSNNRDFVFTDLVSVIILTALKLDPKKEVAPCWLI